MQSRSTGFIEQRFFFPHPPIPFLFSSFADLVSFVSFGPQSHSVMGGLIWFLSPITLVEGGMARGDLDHLLSMRAVIRSSPS